MLRRRTFLKNSIIASTGWIVLPRLTQITNESSNQIIETDLEKEFINPPRSARPHAYWMWMNGHITKEGITLDLEAMKRMELGGAYIFDTALGIPPGPIEYGSNEWVKMLLHTLKEAEKLDLELFIHNSPGFSSSGGPWVTPEMSMQQIVWSETQVNSNEFIDTELSQPYSKLNYYRDAFIIAFPSPEAEVVLMKEKLAGVILNGKKISKEILLDNNPETTIRLEPSGNNAAEILFEFSEPFETRAITITRLAENVKDEYGGTPDQPPVLQLESSDDGKKFHPVCSVSMPLLRYMDAPGAKSFAAVRAKYYRLSSGIPTRISGVELHSSPRLNGWPGKINFTDIAGINENQIIEKEWLIDPQKVIDITDKMQNNGRLKWSPPSSSGKWTILRIGHTTTGTKSAATPDSANGLEIDKFSKEAVDFYFQSFLQKIIQTLKASETKSFKGLTIDSWEIGKQNWTRLFPGEFKQRRNYEITPWLPALTGRIVASVEETEKFLWDLRRTHADLVAENYYGQFKKRCGEYGLQFHAQPNGDGVFDSLQSAQWLDVPMAEYWAHYMPGTLNTCRQAVSIAHTYGKKIAAAEAFTGLPLMSRWTEYPYGLKVQADYYFTLGINHLVFHVVAHQPYTTGFPGMTMGPYGSHFDRKLTWINQASGWIGYISRTQYLLQQGLPVGDVCYFKGEDPASGIPDINYAQPPTPKEYTGDVIGPDVLMRIKIDNGKIVLPDGMSYSLLILAPLKSISTELLDKIKELLAQGMILIVSSRPIGVPGLTNHPEADSGIKKLAEELWGNLDGDTVKDRSFGRGKIYWNVPVAEVLKDLNVIPDFTFTAKNGDAAIHYIQRQLGEIEIYFISNHLRIRQNIVCSFRIREMCPEIWNAETGEISEEALYEFVDGRVQMPLELEPSGSVFVVFRKKKLPQYFSVLYNDKELISTKPYNKVSLNSYNDVTNNFTISLWIKPDTYAYPGKGVVIFPAEGEFIYGRGHTCCGLAAGQNGVKLFERDKGPNRDAREVLSYTIPLEGWTHVAIVYREGKPQLYINGKLVVKGKSSGKIIHPGLNTPPTDERYSAAFEGNYTQPVLYINSMSDKKIYTLFRMGLPDPELPSAVTVKNNDDGKLHAVIWRNGKYLFQGNEQNKLLEIREGCKVIAIEGPWIVQFPKNSGAPPEIQLQKLVSLHKHSYFNIKHFSGTATYLKSFSLSKINLDPGQKIFLDLGRVEVVAELKLNEKNIGALWKEPFRADITEALVDGENKLEIQVTNLWPNRMIGDEYLPKENEYNDNHFITSIPSWYKNNQAKPGQRITFSVWNNFKKTDPLLESGLLGPVRLFLAVEKII